MNDAMPQPDDPSPGHSWVTFRELPRQSIRCLTNHFEVSDNRVDGLRVAQERCAIHARDESLDPVDSLQHVLDQQAG
jgi:hypothetical protein